MSTAPSRRRELGSELGPPLHGLTCLGKIGSGGFADVYLYQQERLSRPVAVKLMKPDALDDGKRRRFQTEAEAMVALGDHPHIVKILDTGTAPDGRPYLVMQYLEAEDLGTQVATAPLSVETTLRYGVQLASAVETAHRAGIVHRDIKPSNILVSTYADAMLGDFGVAGRRAEIGNGETEEVAVSMPWTPVEVLTSGSDGSHVSDVYSLGATLWHLLMGRSPFEVPGEVDQSAMFRRILAGRVPAMNRHDVPSSLERLLQRAMSKDPASRPQSALELAQQLQSIQGEVGLPVTELSVAGEAATPRPAPSSPPDPVESRPSTPRPDSVADVPTKRPPAVVQQAQDTARAPHRVAAQVESLTPERPAETTASADSRPPATRWIAGAAVVALAVAIGLGVLLNRGPATEDETTPDPPVSSEPEDVLPPGSTLMAPVSVRGERTGDTVVFTWRAVDGATAYAWTSADGGGVVRVTRVSVEAAPSGKTCVDVRSQSDGLTSQGATRGCA